MEDNQDKSRGIPLNDEVWAALNAEAAKNDRSASREAAAIIKRALGFTASIAK